MRLKMATRDLTRDGTYVTKRKRSGAMATRDLTRDGTTVTKHGTR